MSFGLATSALAVKEENSYCPARGEFAALSDVAPLAYGTLCVLSKTRVVFVLLPFGFAFSRCFFSSSLVPSGLLPVATLLISLRFYLDFDIKGI